MKTCNPEQRAKKATQAISAVRSIKDQFNMTELIIALKTANCPYPDRVASILKQQNIITKYKGVYSFVSPEPVHYKTIINDLEKVSLMFRGNQTKSNKVVEKKDEVVKIQLTIEEAISYLKSQGFKVMKPFIQYEEV